MSAIVCGIELNDVEDIAWQVYQLIKNERGDFETDDPEELAELATSMVNTVLHLGGLLERISAANTNGDDQ